MWNRRVFNDPWVFFARLVPCGQCGTINRVYVDDPALLAVCGNCKAAISIDMASHYPFDERRLRRDANNDPYPPTPNSWWRRLGREFRSLMVYGSTRSQAERVAERARYRAADAIRQELCDANREDAERRLAEERRRTDEEARRRAEAVRKAEEQWRRSRAGQLIAGLAEVHRMTGRQFEFYLKEVFECVGHEAEVTQASCDD